MTVRTRPARPSTSTSSASPISSAPTSPEPGRKNGVTTNAKSKALKTKLENSSTNKHHGLASPHGEHRRAWHSRPRLLNYAESLKAIPWQTDNNWIVNGYRPQLLNVRACLWSAIGYVHNETVNIHSHSIGALFYAILLPLHVGCSHFPTLGVFPSALISPSTIIDKAALACYCLSAITCLSLSSWFHTVQCCSKEVCDLAHCGDYIGIVVLIVGSILPGMYYAFHDNPILQWGYMAGITIAGTTAAYIVLSPHHRGHRWHRTLTFIALGLSAVVPCGHVVLAKGLEYGRNVMGLDYIIAGGVSYIAGALLYAARIPERFSPGTFDYVGASHQIFHCFVLLGSWFQFSALRQMVVHHALE